MEGLQKLIPKISRDSKVITSSSSESPFAGGISAASASSDPSRVLVTRPPRNFVSLRTCSKLCAFFFAAGVIVGYTLKRRVRRWAGKLLRRLKDD